MTNQAEHQALNTLKIAVVLLLLFLASAYALTWYAPPFLEVTFIHVGLDIISVVVAAMVASLIWALRRGRTTLNSMVRTS